MSLRPLRHFVLLAGLLGLAALPGPALMAGGYMRSGGQMHLDVGLKLDYGDRFFDKQGHLTSGNCGSAVSVPLYADYGWSYYTTVFANTSLSYRDCPGSQRAYDLGDTEVGLKRRVDPFSNTLVWHAIAILPTSNIGAVRGSSSRSAGLDLGLHWQPRHDPYDLNHERDPYGGSWGFGAGLRTWAEHLPHELWAYAGYGRAISLPDWRLGKGGWSFYGALRYRQSIGQSHVTGGAVDSHDDFRVLGADLSLSHRLGKNESLRLTLSRDLAGENRYVSNSIGIHYGKTIP